MIGFYNYTVILTYLSLISASYGIIVSLSGGGHPYFGAFFLLFSGFCDAFDGKVARMKKDRSPMECHFGIQIDSLSDLVAFGGLPARIGSALIRTSPFIFEISNTYGRVYRKVLVVTLTTILIFYVLAAMIRLAYFNVTEEERQKTETGARKYFTGLPVTSAALIFPFVLLLQYILPADITLVYFGCAVLTGLAFLLRIQIRKPSFKGVLILVGIGAIEFILMLLGKL